MHDYTPRLKALDKRKRTIENIYYTVLACLVFAIYATSEWLTDELIKAVIL